MRIEPHIDYIVLKSESTVEAELLDQWFKREALAAAASYKVGGPCEGLTVTFKKEKSTTSITSQAAVDEFKRLHHNPIVAQLNAELGARQAEIQQLESESIKETKEANELRQRLREAEEIIRGRLIYSETPNCNCASCRGHRWLAAERKEKNNES